MNEATLWILIAVVFVVIATTELIVRLTRGGSVLRALKDWLVKLFDTLTGGL
jgi:hypothetical protein